MTTMNTNGHMARKSLSSQIDRLDSLLDGLADNLNEAVATAVQEAVQLAVRAAVASVVAEVLTNAELLRTLQPPTTPPTPSPSRSWQDTLRQSGHCVQEKLQQAATHACELLARARSGIAPPMRQTWAAVRTRCAQAVTWGTQLRQTLPVFFWLLWHLRQPVLVALVAGVVIGTAAYGAGPMLGGVAGGIVGFATTLAVQAGAWLRQALVPFRLGHS
jgi:hypothetical protein